MKCDKYVVMETTLVDIHSNKVYMIVGDHHTHMPWNFHEDWSNIPWVVIKNVKSLMNCDKYVAIETTLVDIHSNNAYLMIGDDYFHVSFILKISWRLIKYSLSYIQICEKN